MRRLSDITLPQRLYTSSPQASWAHASGFPAGNPEFETRDDNDWELLKPRYSSESAMAFYDRMPGAGFCRDELAEFTGDERV